MIEPDVVVVASGQGPLVDVPAARAVVAADGGLDRAASLGLAVDVVVGDLDSVSTAELERALRQHQVPRGRDREELGQPLDEREDRQRGEGRRSDEEEDGGRHAAADGLSRSVRPPLRQERRPHRRRPPLP